MSPNDSSTSLSFYGRRIVTFCACLLLLNFNGCYSPPAYKVLTPNKTSISSTQSLFWYWSLEHRPVLMAELLSTEHPLGISVSTADSLLQRLDYVDSKRGEQSSRSVREERRTAERNCFSKYFESRSDDYLKECKSDSAIRISISDRKSSTHVLGVAKEDRFLIYWYKWFENEEGKLIAVTNTTSVSRVHVDGIIRKVLKSGRPISSEPERDGTPTVTVFLSIWQGDAIYECVIGNPHLRFYPPFIYYKGGNLMWKNRAYADLLIREIETSIGMPFYTSIVGESGWDPADEGVWINKTDEYINTNDPFFSPPPKRERGY